MGNLWNGLILWYNLNDVQNFWCEITQRFTRNLHKGWKPHFNFTTIFISSNYCYSHSKHSGSSDNEDRKKWNLILLRNNGDKNNGCHGDVYFHQTLKSKHDERKFFQLRQIRFANRNNILQPPNVRKVKNVGAKKF